MNQIKALVSSFFASYLYVKFVEGYIGVGLNAPVTCWLLNDNTTVWDDFADCWLVLLIPFMMQNFRLLMNIGEGLV